MSTATETPIVKMQPKGRADLKPEPIGMRILFFVLAVLALPWVIWAVGWCVGVVWNLLSRGFVVANSY